MAGQRRITWKELLLAGFWVTAFIATHLPKVPQPIHKISDKTMHGTGFAILGCLLSWVLYGRVKGLMRHAGVVLLVIAVYALLDELLQIPVGRHCDFWDWVADMLGATAGLVVFHLLRRITSHNFLAK